MCAVVDAYGEKSIIIANMFHCDKCNIEHEHDHNSCDCHCKDCHHEKHTDGKCDSCDCTDEDIQ
ncbi:MAG: hypothetical protein AAB503_01720 [Patescibacteria group bacterium]